MKVAILTPAFTDLNPGYSLTGIVKDQAHMLRRHGHEVDIFVSEIYNGEEIEGLQKKIPFGRLIDYKTIKDFGLIHPEDFSGEDVAVHTTLPERTAVCLSKELQGYDRVFTHDWVFTGWNLPYYMGLKVASKQSSLSRVRWLHWVHSVPGHKFDWWNIEDLGRYHKIVYPNRTDRERCAEAFRGTWEDVRTIPHIKDIRILNRFVPASWEFIDKHPEVLQSNVVQIYPASVDRLEHKRVREVILTMKYIKSLGHSVCLVIANQWATGRQQKQDVEEYKSMALNNGLTLKEVVFTSDFKPEYEVGIPQDMLVDLFHCSNLFLFPTISETFGLVLPEAILSGGVLPVLNLDLDMMKEISGGRGLFFQFGSYNRTITHQNEDAYYRAIAAIIVERMGEEESLAARTMCRTTYNMDVLYNKVYAPIMEAASGW